MTEPGMRCLGIVTARGGSKGVPDKNIRLLAGKPILNYAIETGLACPYIDTLMVTTDSTAIADIAEQAGADVPFTRPPEMATDDAKQEAAIFHAMDWYENEGNVFDLVCLLQPTEPFRKLVTLNAGFALLQEHPDATGVMSVAPARSAPTSVNSLRPDNTLKDFVDPRFRFANRQDRPDYFDLSAVVAIARWDALREFGSFCHDTALSMVVDPIEAIDIDDPVDFVLAEHLAETGLTDLAALARYVGQKDLTTSE
jgi:CMP-N,N'-diacetyllegionaminic acid synthase